MNTCAIGAAAAASTPAARPETSTTARVVCAASRANASGSPSRPSACADSAGNALVAIGTASTAYGTW